MTTASLSVSEVFTSVQGEGPSVGQPAIFLRLGGCNLACSWCDTPYTWDWNRFDRETETHPREVETLAAQLCDDLGEIELLVITGGEPLIQQRLLVPLLRIIRDKRPKVRFEVETNGTIEPSSALAELIHLFVVSPKLSNSGLAQRNRLRNTALIALEGYRSVLKFVIGAPDDVAEASAVAVDSGFTSTRVWLMPEGTDAKTVIYGMTWLAPLCINLGFNLSTRLHVLLWGDERGT